MNILRGYAPAAFLLFCGAVTFADSQVRVEDLITKVLQQRAASGPLILRNFAAEPSIAIRVETDSVKMPDSVVHSFSLLKLDEVTASASQVVLRGSKRYLVRKAANELAPLAEQEPITITIHVGPGVSEALAEELPCRLFFRDIGSALQAIPEELKTSLPWSINANPVSPKTNKKVCDCTERGSVACADGADQKGLAPPKLLHATDQKASKLILEHGNQQVISAVSVNTAGDVSNIWVEKASSAAAAIATAEATLQDKFSPATCHGTPVPYFVQMVTNYTAP